MEEWGRVSTNRNASQEILVKAEKNLPDLREISRQATGLDA